MGVSLGAQSTMKDESFLQFAVRTLRKPSVLPFFIGGVVVVVGAAFIPISDEDLAKSSESRIPCAGPLAWMLIVGEQLEFVHPDLGHEKSHH